MSTQINKPLKGGRDEKILKFCLIECERSLINHWSGESKLTMTFKAVKTLKPGPRSVELNKFLAFLQFFFQANYRVVLTSAVQKNLRLFVNIPKSFSCFILFKCAWGADCCKQKIIFERIIIDKNWALSTVQSLLKGRTNFKTHVKSGLKDLEFCQNFKQ